MAVSIRKRVHQIVEAAEIGDISSRRFDQFIVTLILLNVIAITLESVASIRAAHATLFFAFEAFSVAVFSTEYVLRIWSCVEAKARARDSNSKHRLRFAMRPLVIIDLLAILPFFLSVLFHVDLRFLRALRLARILKLTRYSPAFALLVRAIEQERHALSAAMFFMLVILIIASSGIYMFENAAQPEAFSSIPAAVWWAVATLTTVGYGDVTPVTAAGKMFGTTIMIVGVGMVALPTAILASSFSEQLQRRREEYQDMVDVALKDGVVTAAEQVELDAIRERLGLSEMDAERILQREVQDLLKDRRSCPHCGKRIGAPETV
ncbi:MAG: ion transporter [Gammaproteobacteria bacterium]|nr:ion transporter [Gammaproteobacteria bacterium]NNM00522.1 ion transporter [Gammaproteobacteria bacterium]